ncbi:MAG: glycerophosphodiester phosphodiesterase family protein [Pirellulaceae bacterium]|nr:glycerophosphodiester phosphodiesterase family protein [Pirellulaceae bacterium]
MLRSYHPWLFLLLLSTTSPAAELFLIAHRGGVVDADHIENSRPALEAAIRRGYSMLEVDIRESRDGHLVVHHDQDFQRFYGDPRRVSEMTWDEMKQLRSRVSALRPLSFAEYAAACQGRIRLMLDTKGRQGPRFSQQLESILKDCDLLNSAYVLGADRSKQALHRKAKVSINRVNLRKAIKNGEPVDQLYFLFELGAKLDKEIIDLARQHQVVVVAAINTFRYPPEQHRRLAAEDIRRLKKLGVTHFQIDSVYEADCRKTESDSK